MINKIKLKCISILMTFISLWLVTNSLMVFAKTDLTIEGSVFGYNSYDIKPTNIDGLTYPILVKVNKVIEGKEKAEFVIVLSYELNKEYAKENFAVDKNLIFKIQRQTFCDKKIESLMIAKEKNENGKVIEFDQGFTLVSGVSKGKLPLNKKTPCYLLISKKEIAEENFKEPSRKIKKSY